MKNSPIKLLCYSPGKEDSTSFYRAWGPLHQIQTDYPVFCTPAQIPSGLEWSELSGFDAVFLQRPWHEGQIKFAKLVKKMSIPLWIDYDDNPFDVPKTFVGSEKYHDKRTQNNINEALSLADVVSCSTNELSNVMTPKARGQVMTIPNAFMSCFTKELVAWEQLRRRKIILWRGSQHHRDNLNYFREEILEFNKAHPEFIFVFMGQLDTWFLTKDMVPGSFLDLPPMMLFDYFYQLYKMPAWCQIVTLPDNSFNRCKSNIAYLEGAGIAGNVCIAPDFPEWNRPGVATYNNKKDFLARLNQVAAMSEAQLNQWGAEGKRYSQDKMSIEKINHLRLKALSILCPDKLKLS